MDVDNRRVAFAPGMTIADRFELLRPFGQGNDGKIVVAHHKTLDVDLALKFIDPELADRPDLRSRFAQEAMAAARIRSPHVVSVLDFGETEGSQPYIAMELLEERACPNVSNTTHVCRCRIRQGFSFTHARALPKRTHKGSSTET